MIKKFKKALASLAAIALVGAPAVLPIAVPAVVSADNIQNNLCQGTNLASGNGTSNDCSGSSTSGLGDLAAKIVNVFSIIVGVTAVIMIIYGGFRYITSGGESGSVSNAKNTLIYAIVGLIIVALAQFIVHYVLNTANNAVSP